MTLKTGRTKDTKIISCHFYQALMQANINQAILVESVLALITITFYSCSVTFYYILIMLIKNDVVTFLLSDVFVCVYFVCILLFLSYIFRVQSWTKCSKWFWRHWVHTTHIKKLDCSLIWNLHRMYRIIRSSNCKFHEKK